MEKAAELRKHKNCDNRFHKRTEAKAESLFANNCLAGCFAEEIRLRGKGSEIDKEEKQKQSDASPSW